MTIELEVRSDEGWRRISVPKSSVIVGRAASSDVVIKSPRASRQHAVLEHASGKLLVTDLGTSLGTFLNGKKISTAELRPGDVLAFPGNVLVRVPAGDQSTPRIPIRVTHAGRTERVIFEKAEVLVGRDAGCTLILNSKLVSRHHTRIAIEDGEYIVEDCGSANRTFVGGQPVIKRSVDVTDVVMIGHFELKIGFADEAFEARERLELEDEVERAEYLWRTQIEDLPPKPPPSSPPRPAPLPPPPPVVHEYKTDLVFSPKPGILAPVPLSQSSDDGTPSVVMEPVRPDTFVDLPTNPAAPEKEPEPLAQNTMIADRYRVIRHLARGGFANVYLVEDTKSWLEQRLALKIPIATGDPEALAQELKSQYKWWKILSDVAPDRFVRLSDITPIELAGEGAVGIFMEYMRGGSLLRMVAKWGGRPKSREQLATLVRLFLQACESVRFMHGYQEGFVHRDVKPANMLLHGDTCKLADFELVALKSQSSPPIKGGTIPYMAPECFDGVASVATDVFAIGASFYHLLYGAPPFGSIVAKQRAPIETLEGMNPLVSSELHRLVLACLEPDPENRPQTVEDFVRDLRQLGLTDDDANTAPVVLARLLLRHLAPVDLEHMVRSLEGRGFRSRREDGRDADIIEEYCYAEPPHEVLAQHCTARQAAEIARALGLENIDEADRDAMIARILESVGFRSSVKEIPGIESTRAFVEKQLLDLAHSTSTDECTGMTLSALLAVEKIVDILLRFFGQLVHGAALPGYIARKVSGKGIDQLGFGHRVGLLRSVCVDPPKPRPRDRNAAVFTWPIIDRQTFEGLDMLVSARNDLAHKSQIAGLRDAQRIGRAVLLRATDVMARLAENSLMPRCVQITSRQDDVYGRHFYLGRDDRGRSERIFTPLPLEVGRVYLMYALTNPVRINPAIFPLHP